jgi:pilus assembly protein CpaF
MAGRLIALVSIANAEGLDLMGRGLAAACAGEARAALWVYPTAETQSNDRSNLAAKFRSLSPQLLRNFLNPSGACPAEMSYPLQTSDGVYLQLIPLLRSSFEWILWDASGEWHAGSTLLFDQADLILLVAPVDALSGLAAASQRIAEMHLPKDLARVVLCKATPKSLRQTLTAAALHALPDEVPPGPAFHASLQRLAQSLRTRDELFLRKRPAQDGESPEQVAAKIRQQVRPLLTEAIETRVPGGPAQQSLARETVERCLADAIGAPVAREARDAIFTRVMNDVLGLGPLEALLQDPEISEIMVNGQHQVYVERRGQIHLSPTTFESDAEIRTLIERIVAPIGRRVDESAPLCDARLPDGSRVNIVLPPLALDGPVVTIRKFGARCFGVEDLIESGSLNRAMADYLRQAVQNRRNIVVSGGTGSGKTTLLNVLSGLIPDNERIVTIEDAAELRLQKPHVVRLESRPANAEGEGAVPIRRLVINALRMRPDRLVIGECRGGEALDMLQAMNTGHDGSLTTLHANSPRDALRRLETLVLMAGIDLPLRVVREQIQSAVHLILQQARMADGKRRVVSITEISGMEGDVITLYERFRFDKESGCYCSL